MYVLFVCSAHDSFSRLASASTRYFFLFRLNTRQQLSYQAALVYSYDTCGAAGTGYGYGSSLVRSTRYSVVRVRAYTQHDASLRTSYLMPSLVPGTYHSASSIYLSTSYSSSTTSRPQTPVKSLLSVGLLCCDHRDRGAASSCTPFLFLFSPCYLYSLLCGPVFSPALSPR